MHFTTFRSLVSFFRNFFLPTTFSHTHTHDPRHLAKLHFLECGHLGYHLALDELEVYGFMTLSCNTGKVREAGQALFVVGDATLYQRPDC